jgi:parvulin-like peptidyl-prolyl isomerase
MCARQHEWRFFREMRVLRFAPGLAAIGAVAALAAGCGGSSGSSSGSGGSSESSNLGAGVVAVVGGQKVTQLQLNDVLAFAKAQYKSQGQTFPAVGSPTYKQVQDRALDYLTQRAELDQKAKQLGIVITNQEINQRLEQLKKQSFGGSEKRYEAQLKKQGFTDQQVRDEVIRPPLLSAALTKKITSSITISDADLRAYYDQHSQNYAQPQTRQVEHILVSLDKNGKPVKAGGKVDYAKSKVLADKLYKQLKAGANFATLAKKYSQDPSSRPLGGKFTATRGRDVPQFDDVAFTLSTGQISKPLKTIYGWHIIEATANAKPRQVVPFDKVKAAIRQTLLAPKQSQAMASWVQKVTNEFCNGKITYSKGFTPSPDPCAKKK